MFISTHCTFLMFSLLNVSDMASGKQQDTGFTSVTLSNYFCVFFLAHCFIVPVAISVYLCRNRERIQDKDFLKRVGTFLAGARTNKSSDLKGAIMIQVAFFTRSLIISISVIVLYFSSWG